MVSVYSSGFNLILNQFDYESSINNFCNFADDVFIAVNKSKDDTYNQLAKLTNKYNNLHLISTNISYSNPLVDGLIKNEALRFSESNPKTKYLIGVDLDENIPLKHKDRWREFAELFLGYYQWDGVLIPSIDLFGSLNTVKWEDNKPNKKYKFYLHRKGLKRGPVNYGLKPDGRLDINKSDGCDILLENGELANCPRFDAHLDCIFDCKSYYKELDNLFIYVIHKGYLDFNKRIVRNNNFWEKQWKNCSGNKDLIIDNSIEKFNSYQLQEHGLDLS